MQGDPKIIGLLNEVLTNELTSVNQYFLHARMYDNWGYRRLGHATYEESIEEMKHADRLVKRVLFLEGLPNLQDLHKLMIGEDVPEALRNDLATERRGHVTLVAAIAACEEAKDYVSRDILTGILDDTEKHIDFLEKQLSVLSNVGLQNYLQSQAGSAESAD
ncbi:MAG: bacterioferritin [Alphaproteobacteria bacterium]